MKKIYDQYREVILSGNYCIKKVIMKKVIEHLHNSVEQMQQENLEEKITYHTTTGHLRYIKSLLVTCESKPACPIKGLQKRKSEQVSIYGNILNI